LHDSLLRATLLPVVDLDRRLGWTARVADLLHDPRDPAKTRHTLLQFVRQRLFGLVAGYEDGNDHTRLRAGSPSSSARVEA